MPTAKMQFNLSLTVPEWDALTIAAKAQGLKPTTFARECILKRISVNLPKKPQRKTELWREDELD